MKERPAVEQSQQALDALAHLEQALTANDTAIGNSTRAEIWSRLHRLLRIRDAQPASEVETPAETITVRLRTTLTVGSRVRTDDIATLTGYRDSAGSGFVVTRIDIFGEMWTDTAYDIARRLGVYDELKRALSSASRMDRVHLDYHLIFDKPSRPTLRASVSGNCTTEWNPTWIPQQEPTPVKVTIAEDAGCLRATLTKLN